MTKRDHVEFARTMMALSEVFDGGREPSPLKVELYFRSLREYQIGDIKNAVSVMIRTRVFPSFPKPAEIIQEIIGTSEDRAVSSWIMVVDAIRRYGSYDSVSFDDPVIHSVVDVMGGWPKLCQEREDDLKWKQKEFERLYLVIAGRDGNHPEHLPGLIEMDNRARGYDDHIPEPSRISGTSRKMLPWDGEKE